MATDDIEDLEPFLKTLDAPTLASVLLELAREHDPVRRRLARLKLADRPDRLAATFRKTLAGWRRASKFLGYREAREFGLQLEGWLGQIERELMPRDPSAALALAESYINADAAFFERADDSDGSIGDAVRAGCRLWLTAASRCESPADQWPGRLAELVTADEYGAREELLRRADILLDEPALRRLVTLFETRMQEALAGPPGSGRHPHGVFAASAALSLLSEALHDPDVHVRAVLAYSPQPNPQQKGSFARAYLEQGRPADAMRWLDGAWQHREDTRQSMLAEALGALGRREESAEIRQRLFEQTLAVHDFHAWLEALPPASQAAAVDRARQVVANHEDPVTSALLLLDIGDGAAAEARIVAAPERIRGSEYYRLVPMAEAFEARQRRVGDTAVYRALLAEVLARAYAKAYGHGARYWMRLQALASQGDSLDPLEPHASFVQKVQTAHARKASFWQSVKEATERSDGKSGRG